jgi:hypothetical protein
MGQRLGEGELSSFAGHVRGFSQKNDAKITESSGKVHIYKSSTFAFIYCAKNNYLRQMSLSGLVDETLHSMIYVARHTLECDLYEGRAKPLNMLMILERKKT